MATLLAASAAAAFDAALPLPQLVHDAWGTREGLPVDSTFDLRVSREGFVWIATTDGLARFDGVRFRTFHHGGASGLPASYVLQLGEDASGQLLVATNAGVARLEPDGFRDITPSGPPRAYIALAAAGTANGDIWVGTPEGLLRLRAGGGVLALGVADGLPHPVVRRLIPDGDRLWVGTDGGLALVRDGRVERPPGPRVRVTALAADLGGEVWVGTPGGLLRGDARGLRPAPGTTEQVSAVHVDREGMVWFGTRDAIHRQRRDGQGHESLAVPSGVRSIAQDREDSLWFSSHSQGLHRLRAGAFVTFGGPEGVRGDEVTSVLPGPGDTVWLGTLHGLHELSGGRARAVAGAPDVPVGAMLRLRDGRLVFGAASGRVFRATPGRPAELLVDLDVDGKVYALAEDPDGSLWVACGGLFGRLRAGRLERVEFAPELARAYVFAMARDQAGTLWVATDEGLARLEAGRLVLAARDDAVWNQMNSLLPAAGGVWVGTDGGLGWYEGGRLRKLGAKEGVPEMPVAGIELDAHGRLWIFGPRGVASVPVTALQGEGGGPTRVTTYGLAHGLRSLESSGTYHPQVARAADGRLWFATVRGASVVDPGALHSNPIAPPVLLERVVADGRSYPTRATVRLPPGTRHLAIEYLGLGLRAGGGVQFRRRLVGLDDEYVDAGTERVASYTTLAPGPYELWVMAANEDGVWNQPRALLSLVVEPYFWQTASFRLATALAAALLVWGVVRLRTRALRERERLLTTRVEEALSQVRVLRGLLPICAWCKKIRDDGGYWRQMEAYVSAHSEAEFTHGMCPDCYQRLGDDDK